MAANPDAGAADDSGTTTPLEGAELLEQLGDAADVRAARRALTGPDDAVSWARLKVELHL